MRTTPAAEDRPVHDQRDHHPERELDRDRDHGDEQRVEDVLPPEARGEHGLVVGEPGEAALVGEAQVEVLQREDDRVADRVGGDQQHRDHRRRAEHPAEPALGAGALGDPAGGRPRSRLPLDASLKQALPLDGVLDVLAQLVVAEPGSSGSILSGGWIERWIASERSL